MASASAPAAAASRRDALEKDLSAALRALFRAKSRLRGREAHLGPSQLSHAQFELLAELFDRGALPAGELALAAGLAPATVTQMLEGLAESGHVERLRSDTDRRVVVSRLTPDGERRIEAKREAWGDSWRAALEGVSDGELRGAAKVLRRLAHMVEEGPPQEPRSDPRKGPL